jgi:chloride channel protein, CIC family
MTAGEAPRPRESVGVRAPTDYELVDRRTVTITVYAVIVAVGAGLAAQLLLRLIALFTNIAFYGRLSIQHAEPAGGHRSVVALLLTPIIGALIVGVMARYGSPAIRGHGIPEVMEKVLYGESRMSFRVAILKPLSAAIAIGTGGPFGAEGPIIATGGALGSVIGQFIIVTADERKTLLAAGAAAGMTATFGSPVSAVLLAVELLLLEYRPRSLIPVALASAVATGVRAIFEGTEPVFHAPAITQPSLVGLGAYTVLGLFIGVLAVGLTRASYGIEDVFEHFGERFHIHWMWWPAFGAIAVGVIGLIEPRTLGIGYSNISGALAGSFTVRTMFALAILKFISWVIYLGSGTSGGTLAPMFTMGSALGGAIGALVAAALPQLGVDPRVAALVGMASIFAGATHALLASIVFAFETTRQPLGLLPLLSGCSASYLVSLLLMRHSLLTEKLARRGASLRAEYAADHLAYIAVRDAASREVVTLRATETLGDVRARLGAAGAVSHQGFPVLNENNLLVGVVTRRDLLDPSRTAETHVRDVIRRPPVVVYDDNTLRDAADHMVIEQVGRLPVVTRAAPRVVVGIVTRSDLLTAHAPRLRAARDARRVRSLLGRWDPAQPEPSERNG